MTAHITDKQLMAAVLEAHHSCPHLPGTSNWAHWVGSRVLALAPQQPSEPPPADLYGQMKAWEQSGELIPRAWATMRDQELLIKKLEAQIAAQQPTQGAEEGGWGIDVSAGREILVYGRCSVIEEEQARYVLNLIAADTARPAPEASGAMPLSEEQRKDVLCAALCISARGDDSVVLTERDAERIVELLTDIAGFDLSGISATSKEAGE